MKNILVVGGTKGIGKEIVQRLAHGQIYVIARNLGETSDNKAIHFIQGDVTSNTIDLAQLPPELHGLVYCPGTINLQPFHRLTEEDFFGDWQLNFLSVAKLIQALLPRLKKTEQASIVLFSTVATHVGMPYHSSIASAKGAVEGLTRSLAAEFAPKIRVNCIAPSLTQTSLAEKLTNTTEKLEASARRHPMQRIGMPSDIAELACFLLSEKAAWITGQVMHVDGGLSTLKV